MVKSTIHHARPLLLEGILTPPNATLAILKDVIGYDTWKNDPRAEIGGF
ncbi:hypothetical protein Tco_0845244, partial [Tanacetum coccineum]